MSNCCKSVSCMNLKRPFRSPSLCLECGEGFTQGRPVGRDNQRQGQSLSFPRYKTFRPFLGIRAFHPFPITIIVFISFWRRNLSETKTLCGKFLSNANCMLRQLDSARQKILKKKLSVESLHPTMLSWLDIARKNTFWKSLYSDVRCIACWCDWISQDKPAW